MCRAGLDGHFFADQVFRGLDIAFFQRDDGKAVGLQNRSNDFDRRSLGAQLHGGRGIGKADIGLAGGNHLCRGARALAFFDCQIDAGFFIKTKLLGHHETGIGCGSKKIQSQFQRLCLLCETRLRACHHHGCHKQYQQSVFHH